MAGGVLQQPQPEDTPSPPLEPSAPPPAHAAGGAPRREAEGEGAACRAGMNNPQESTEPSHDGRESPTHGSTSTETGRTRGRGSGQHQHQQQQQQQSTAQTGQGAGSSEDQEAKLRRQQMLNKAAQQRYRWGWRRDTGLGGRPCGLGASRRACEGGRKAPPLTPPRHRRRGREPEAAGADVGMRASALLSHGLMYRIHAASSTTAFRPRLPTQPLACVGAPATRARVIGATRTHARA